jgi:hypothetical protein
MDLEIVCSGVQNSMYTDAGPFCPVLGGSGVHGPALVNRLNPPPLLFYCAKACHILPPGQHGSESAAQEYA